MFSTEFFFCHWIYNTQHTNLHIVDAQKIGSLTDETVMLLNNLKFHFKIY